MENGADYIIDILKKQISGFRAEEKMEAIGQVLKIADGVAALSGLGGAKLGELLEFPGDVFGVVLNLEENQVGVVILGDYLKIKEGDIVKSTGRILEVPVGEGLIGRVVNSLGQPKDNKGDIKKAGFYPVEKVAPRVITRKGVNTPLHTGIKSIDAMFPIGRGQRELIIGDRQTGKTAIAVDAIIAQLNEPEEQRPICIYVAIGQKESKIAKIVAKLEEAGAMDYTIIVTAGASESAALSYFAPYAGCAMGEYFMDKGKDVLIIYDDLSKHAWAYRQVSLLLRRPPGREAYPGDVFYLHSRLLERSARMSEEYGGGSITALPIIETQAGDVSAYIPTNVISITDGQIFLETDLFYQGIRPAVNVGLSVSRVGSAAQTKAMKKVAGKLKLEAAQYRELAAFAQFGSDLDEETKAKIERGRRIEELLKQDQYQPMPFYKQVCILYAVINGYADDIAVENLKSFEEGLLSYIENQKKEIFDSLSENKVLDEKTEKNLKAAIESFKSSFISK